MLCYIDTNITVNEDGYFLLLDIWESLILMALYMTLQRLTLLEYYQPHSTLVPSREVWDNAVFEANEVYKGRVHNLFWDNCHSHVAYAFNKMSFQGKCNWSMISVAVLLFRHGKYVSKRHCLTSWLPFILIVCIVLTIISIILHIS
ncbi:Transmembrane protein 222 [Schistosoma japonicum]|nr:Transmembrane protein 222 [Schistosoma japonicum]